MSDLGLDTVDTRHPLTSKQAVCERLGITPRHLDHLVTTRRIPFIKVGGLIRFDPADIEAWIEANRVEVA